MILGVDPSQRHTGLCLLTKAGPVFHEIKPTEPDVLSSTRRTRLELDVFLAEHLEEDIEAYVVEKQLSVGARASSLLFHVQLTVLDSLMPSDPRDHTPTLIMPMPGQLQSYIRQRHAFTGSTDTGLVQHFKKQTSHQGRISIHCVDAYYLARLGEDVLHGTWRYKLPEKEVPLTPYLVTNGDKW